MCRHCGSHFGELWELRRHIERGSCDQLDPLGDQELGTVLRSDDYFMPLIQAGKWGEAVRESAMRHQLTMMCSFCGQAYSRTADLVRHLQCHHGGFYREADLMSNLVDEAKMTCICKPCRIPQPRSHRCPAYRQLAMLQYLLDPRHRKLILPWTISPDTLHKLIQLHAALHAQVPALAHGFSVRVRTPGNSFFATARSSAPHVHCALATLRPAFNCLNIFFNSIDLRVATMASFSMCSTVFSWLNGLPCVIHFHALGAIQLSRTMP